ncbi:Alpha-1,3-mannosyltransferase-like protein [Hypoxylon texense]
MRNELDVDLGMDRFPLDRPLPTNPSDPRRIVVVIIVEVVGEVVAIGTTGAGDEASLMIVTGMDRVLDLVLRRDVTGTETIATVIPDTSTLTCVHATLETTVTCGIVKFGHDLIEPRMNHLRCRQKTSHLLRLPLLLLPLGQTASVSDVGSATGKAPPTGPRALKEERPAPLGISPNADSRPPPTGPSRSTYMEMSPSAIPSGPRAQTRPGPSSKQWINPNIKNRTPESPKMNRSQSFAQPRPAGFRQDGASSDQPVDNNQRPHSSDERADSQLASTERQLRDSHIVDAVEESAKPEQRPQSARSSMDRDQKLKDAPSPAKDEEDGEVRQTDDVVGVSSISGTEVLPKTDETNTKPHRRPTLKVSSKHVSLPRKEVKLPMLDQSSESDDEEFGDVIESQMAEVETKLKQLEGMEEAVPMDAIIRHAIVSLEAVAKIVNEPEGLEDMVGPIPDIVSPRGKTPAEPEQQVERAPSAQETKEIEDTNAIVKEKTPSPVVEQPPPAVSAADASAELPQPSIEQDIDEPVSHEAPPDEKRSKSDDGDVTMEDALDISQADSETQAPLRTQLSTSHRQSADPPFEEAQIQSGGHSKRGSSIPTPAEEDEDATDIEDIDLQSIEIIREHMATPPIDSLPYYDEKPWFKDQAFIRLMNAPQPDLNSFILRRLEDEATTRIEQETQLKKRYDVNYDHYLRFTMSDDPVAVKSREKFTSIAGLEQSNQKPGFHEAKPEGTRRSRYASERDLQRILEESRQVEDEKRERQMQAERERYRTEKEAVLPRQYQAPEERENDFYRDVNGFIQAEKIVTAWELLPPVDNFTEEETAQFEKAYLEFPKQWGRVSEPLANRDFGTSIQFYYLKKEKSQLNLKEKLKKRPRQRKRGGRGKQRSSALVSELGNGDNDNEETHDTGENGERRRPRRAAAPTFNSEATPATDGESGTPAGTPGRRAGGSRGDGTDRPERKPRGRRAAKDKEAKQPRVNQTLAAAPPAGTKGNRSRSSSRVVPPPEWTPQQAQGETARAPVQYEMVPGSAAVPPVAIPAPFAPPQPIHSPERGIPPPPPPPPSVPMNVDTMGPPPLRPEPPQQPQVAMLDLGPAQVTDRKSGTQASSYWSVPEANDFPHLLRSFGSDWQAIASHMRTKTPVMIKNYYTRKKDGHDWEGIVREADASKARGEKRPAPPAPSSGTKKRYETSSNRPLAAADAIIEEAPPSKLEHPQTQPTTGRFNVPIAAQPQPQPTLLQSPFGPTSQPALVQSHAATPPGSQSIAQPVTQTMSPRPMRAPFPFAERERELSAQQQQPSRVALSQKPTQPPPPPVSEAPMGRHPLPTSLIEPQMERERPKTELKAPKEQPRHQERQQLRVKQEPDLIHQYEPFVPQAQPSRMAPSRPDNVPMSRPPDPPRAVAPAPTPAPASAPQAQFATILQQPGRALLSDSNPSSPARPRPLSNLSRPTSGASGGTEPFSAPPPPQPTPPAVAPPPSRPPERKTSNLMALLNDDPPPPPKRVAEVPVATKPSSTPPAQTNLSRPPPPPPPPSHIRRDSGVPEARGYGYGRNPPPAPSAMPPLKPYSSASPQTQPMNAPRHMPLEAAAEQEYYGGRPRSFPSAHQQPPVNSPQSAHHYPPPNQPSQMQYQPQPSYPYGAQVQPPNAASPPPQYGGHPAPRGHEHQSSRDGGWPGTHQGHPLQQQHQQHQQQQPPPPPPPPPQQQPTWASHPPQPPKSTQPPPTQSAWAAQHAPAPKPPPPSSSVPPQPSWATAPPPRGHESIALRDVYPPHRMQAPLQQYAPASRAPEPPPPQAPAAYPRYASTPGPGRDPRDPGPPRSYTPVSYDNRGYPPHSTQEIREAQLREQQQQQQSILQQQQQQLRPDNRHLYDRPQPDRYGR